MLFLRVILVHIGNFLVFLSQVFGWTNMTEQEITRIIQYEGKEQTTLTRLRKRVNKALSEGNNGVIRRIGRIRLLLYPSYSQEKGISDILNNRDTSDAALLFALSTKNNKSEIQISSQESILRQLYAPIPMDIDLPEYPILSDEEYSLICTINNLISSYDEVCQRFEVERQELGPLAPSEQYPFVNPVALARIRKQAFRCLLSIKDLDPLIRDQFLNVLENDDKLLDVCEVTKDRDIQLFLISYVEINFDIEAWEVITLKLLRAFNNGDLEPLAEHLNAVVERLTKAGIKHDLPTYTKDNLPPIELPS